MSEAMEMSITNDNQNSTTAGINAACAMLVQSSDSTETNQPMTFESHGHAYYLDPSSSQVYITVASADPGQSYPTKLVVSSDRSQLVDLYVRQEDGSLVSLKKQMPMKYLRTLSPTVHQAVMVLPQEQRKQVARVALPAGNVKAYRFLHDHLRDCANQHWVRPIDLVETNTVSTYKHVGDIAEKLGLVLIAKNLAWRFEQITTVSKTGYWKISKEEVVDIWTECDSGDPLRQLVAKNLAQVWVTAKCEAAAKGRVKHLLQLEAELPEFWDDWDIAIGNAVRAREAAERVVEDDGEIGEAGK